MNKQATGDGTVGKALDVLDQVAAKGKPVRFSELLSESAPESFALSVPANTGEARHACL
jgi:hypothetical protein